MWAGRASGFEHVRKLKKPSGAGAQVVKKLLEQRMRAVQLQLLLSWRLQCTAGRSRDSKDMEKTIGNILVYKYIYI